MDKYFYFVSQLPALQFDRDPIITIDNFIIEAEKWLSKSDFAILSRVDPVEITPEKDDPEVLKHYKKNQAVFLEELVLWRKSKTTEREYKSHLFPLHLLKEGTPLDAERLMLKWKWDEIEEQEYKHHFDLEFLIIYFMKLKILHKLKSFDSERGLKKYQSLCEAEIWIEHPEQ
ncbi:MAG: hypothetical protein WBM02_12345 [bacterium]